MANLNGYNAEDHEPLGDFTPIEPGDYLAIATASEFKPTKKNDGEYLQIEWEIVAGEHAGRKLWSRLNIKNPSSKAVEIANRELSSICRAVNVLRPKDSEEFHGKPLRLTVEVEENNGKRSNVIKKYAASDAKIESKPAAQSKMPWQK